MDKIDLTKPQIISGDVKVRVWKNKWNKHLAVVRYLALISPDGCSWCWINGCTGEEHNFDYSNIILWQNVELFEEPKTRLMTRREILVNVSTMDKDNPFLVCISVKDEKLADIDFSRWMPAQSLSYRKASAYYYYKRHIHPVTGEWTSEPMQFLTEEKEGE